MTAQRKSAAGHATAAWLLAGGAAGFALAPGPDLGPFPVFVLLAAAAVWRGLWRPVLLVLAGSLLAASVTRDALDERLDADMAGVDVVGRFRLAEFPVADGGLLRLVVAPDDRDDLPARIRLSWYDPLAIPGPGECRRLEVRLRRPRGLANPDGFDYEGWLFRERIGATGYVRRDLGHAECERADGLAALRRELDARLAATLPPGEAAAALEAVAVGARHRIGREQWNRYAVTGTSHLMAISGLHVGLAAATAFVLLRSGLALAGARNPRDRAALPALVAALAYVAVAGAAVPARRALGMLLVVALGQRLRRRAVPMHILGLVAAAVFVANPIDALTPGFQLSFAAVAVLLAAQRQRGPVRLAHGAAGTLRRLLGRLPYLQFALLFGLLPLTVLHFDRVAWLGPAVNLLVVPIFTFVTVPAALVGTAFVDGPAAVGALGELLLRVAWYSLRVALWLVREAAGLAGADLPVAAHHGLQVVVPWLALGWVLLPPGWPGRRLAIIATMATVLYRPDPPAAGCAELDVLDVGQGLAIVVRTRQHVLLYDAGPSFRGGASTGALVVAPYLRMTGVRSVDLLIASHADSDHAGGIRDVVRLHPARSLLSGEWLPGIDAPQFACQAGQVWHWDGIRFSVLYPLRPGREGNDASCVIELRAGKYAALLTGDVEIAGERGMLSARLIEPADLVVVPHHGSRSSSHPAFVDATGASVAIVSAGHANRWNLPRPDVVERWRASGAELHDTAVDGAVRYRLCENEGLELVGRERRDRRRAWTER